MPKGNWLVFNHYCVNYDSRIFQAHGYDEQSHRGLFCSSVGGLSGVRF